jgi:arylsulfatase A-like enzyme
MNVIVICCDTLRYDYLGCNGSTWVRTPNLDRLAAQSVAFDNAWIGSYPTIPHRLECLTGQRGEPFQPWIPLPWEAVTLPGILGRHGYAFPFSLDKARAPFLMAQYYRNHIDRRTEADYGIPQVMGAAAEWLERNLGHEQTFLWLDVFDVHEPWDPPRGYIDMYDPGYEGEEIVYPKRGPCDDFSAAEQQHIRALYAANITMFDRWLGLLLDQIEVLGLAEDTMLVFMSDHGQHMGDHRSFFCKSQYLYHEMAHWVLMMRLPGGEGAGTRVRGTLAQPIDLLPTVLDRAGIAVPEGAEGVSLLPCARGESLRPRDAAFSGSSLPWPDARPVSLTDGRWAFLDTGDPQEWELYDMDADPEQQHNLAGEHPDRVARMHRAVIDYLRARGTPEVCVQAFEEARPGGARPELLDALRAEQARFPQVFVRENYVPFEWEA